VLGIVLGLYIGFPKLNQLRFIARDPILTGILKVAKLPVQSRTHHPKDAQSSKKVKKVKSSPHAEPYRKTSRHSTDEASGRLSRTGGFSSEDKSEFEIGITKSECKIGIRQEGQACYFQKP
jgi:hypothetical protein